MLFRSDQLANPDIDVSKLTKEDARKIYRDRYWSKSGAADLPENLALVHFDAAVNQGPEKAKQLLEASGGDADKYLELRKAEYERLAKQDPEKYGSSLKGWMNRLDALRSISAPSFEEYTGEILPLEGKKAVKKPATPGEYQLSPEEQMMAPVGADTTGGIELSDYGKLFGAGAEIGRAHV